MAYTAQISRANPTCFIFLIDQSGSMSENYTGGNSTKAEFVATATNRVIQNLIIRCAKPEPRDYFHIGVIGYGTNVGPAFGGTLGGRELVPISDIAISPLRVEERIRKVSDDIGGLIEQKTKFPIWFDPIADGGTPMCQALGTAKTILENWLSQHPNCFPPTILNITDGEPTDGNPRSAADSLKQLNSSDGGVLLLNCHTSSKSSAPAILFPNNSDGLPDDHARLLFDMSSIMPELIRLRASELGFGVTDSSRGFVFNADPSDIVNFLDIGTSGTKPADLR